MQVHLLKTDALVYDDEVSGRKPFMIRTNDRNYQVGDIIISNQTRYTGYEMKQGLPLIFTGRQMVARIDYIFSGPFYTLPEGTVVMSYTTLEVK